MKQKHHLEISTVHCHWWMDADVREAPADPLQLLQMAKFVSYKPTRTPADEPRWKLLVGPDKPSRSAADL